jgi:hypothetical protein
MRTYPIRLKVRALLRHEQIDFEQHLEMRCEPFEGMALDVGRVGKERPLFLHSVNYSIAEGCFLCRAEDDLAADEFGDDTVGLVAEYLAAGWHLAFCDRLRIGLPKRAAS